MANNIYEMVTARIIEQMEQGIIPWQKPWTGRRGGAYSRSTGKAYSLLNQFLLAKPGEYLTFKQAQEAGGHIRKGEKGSIVVFWKQVPITETNDEGETVTRTIPVLRYYTVFHIDQCEGIEPKWTDETRAEVEADETAEDLIHDYLDATGVDLYNVRSDRAFYSPASDCIQLPLMEQFTNTAEYYSTAFHEMVHSTGHASRLNRLNKTAAFGSEDYGREELVAEIGAAQLVNVCGLETTGSFKNSVAYLQSWIRAIKDDPRMIVTAASKAEKAVDFILSVPRTVPF